ncbi:hypothetical protein EGW08_006217 [Elysia chlorotica]|uniref:Uncharacterized protein n=1 Tax=Elysia chlorotica TaxID=188477 RepID=A0A3S0ZSY8_ELYCH|nr:hypothetical protein EGW08_006217 [Elysia chlorotica]
MGAGISICHCNSSHATSPDKANLRSLDQPHRGNTAPTGLDSFFTVGKSLSAPSSSPKNSGPRKNGSYKPQKTVIIGDNSFSTKLHLKEHNNNNNNNSLSFPDSKSPKSPEKVIDEQIIQTKCSASPEPTSSDSALVIDLTEENNTESKADSSSAENKPILLPSQAQRPKSAAPSRSMRRSYRRQRSLKNEKTLEEKDAEKTREDPKTPEDEGLPPFRRFRPKSARDPRRRSNRVTDYRGQGQSQGQGQGKSSSSISRSLSMPSRKSLKSLRLSLKRSDGESSGLSDSEDSGSISGSNISDTDTDSDGALCSSDTLSIPDETETDPAGRLPTAVTTITVKPKVGHSASAASQAHRKNSKNRANPKNSKKVLLHLGTSEVKGGIWEKSSHSKSESPGFASNSGMNNNNNRARTAGNIAAYNYNNNTNTDDNNNNDGDDNEDFINNDHDSNNCSYNSNSNFFSSSYHGSGYGEEERSGGGGGGGFSKKASERSISGVILLTPCELPDFIPTHITCTSPVLKSSIPSSPVCGPSSPSVQTPNQTPRTPATIKLNPLAASLSPTPPSPLPQSLDLPPANVNNTSYSKERPRDSPNFSPTSTYIPSRSPPTLSANPDNSTETNSVCSDCLRVIPPANRTIDGAELEVSYVPL